MNRIYMYINKVKTIVEVLINMSLKALVDNYVKKNSEFNWIFFLKSSKWRSSRKSDFDVHSSILYITFYIYITVNNFVNAFCRVRILICLTFFILINMNKWLSLKCILTQKRNCTLGVSLIYSGHSCENI